MIVNPIALTMPGDCKESLQWLIDNNIQVDSIVTDPPYELGFMGKAWDATGIAYDVDTWKLAFQVLKPGGHLLSFGGSRTYHRMACAIEDAGFEIRDQIMWIYGSGFPKSLNVSKAIDKMAGEKRKVMYTNIESKINPLRNAARIYACGLSNSWDITAPATDAAKQWDGWGSALKPSHEPIVVARKPLDKGCNIAQNVLKHGTGGINIDGCRVSICSEDDIHKKNPHTVTKGGGLVSTGLYPNLYKVPQGRFPANIIHDGSDEVMEEFAKYGEKNGHSGVRIKAGKVSHGYNKNPTTQVDGPSYDHLNDKGTAARFFYSAKASKTDRAGSNHPTVKPVALIQYLVRLVTPPNGIVLDMFAGSGTTGQAAIQEGFKVILMEREPAYLQDIATRLNSCFNKDKEEETNQYEQLELV